MIALALDPESRRQALDDLHAPDFVLPDLEGNEHALSEWQGQKKLLVTFASWCGCRYDLPGWQALHDELAPAGFSVIGVAIDNAPEDVAPWTEGITFPVLYDSNHVLTELYAISNVPTVVWIDEDDDIVRPNGVAFGSDLFIEFTGVESAPAPGGGPLLGDGGSGAHCRRSGAPGRRRPERGRGGRPSPLSHRGRRACVGATATWPAGRWPGPLSWLPSTGRCAGPPCPWWARTHSVRGS